MEFVEDEKEPPIQELEEKPVSISDDPVFQEVEKKLDEALERSIVKQAKTKNELIVQIKKLGNHDLSDRVLTRMKKSDLKEMLTANFEKSLEDVISPVPIEAPADKADPNRNMVVQTMYRITMACATGLEGLTKAYHPYLNGYCLHEYAQNIDSNPVYKEITLEVLRELYEENQELLCNMMTKEGRLMCVLVMAGAASVRPFSSIENGRARHDSFRAQQDSMHSRPQRFREEQFNDGMFAPANRRRKPRVGKPMRCGPSVCEPSLTATVGVAEQDKTPPCVPIPQRGCDSGLLYNEPKAPKLPSA